MPMSDEMKAALDAAVKHGAPLGSVVFAKMVQAYQRELYQQELQRLSEHQMLLGLIRVLLEELGENGDPTIKAMAHRTLARYPGQEA